MKNGISTNRDVTQSATCLKGVGIDFVFRYYSTTTTQPEKRLTRSEANSILAAGLTLGVVYEDGPTDVTYFSTQRGNQDAINAFNAAVSLGQPAASAIYFTVDYDASAADVSGPISDYFTGVNQGMQQAASAAGVVPYSIGVYGSGDVCSFIKGQNSLAKYSWLSESTGWGGSKNYSNWDVNQAIPTADICGFTANPQTYDENRALDDFGGFASLVSIDRLLTRHAFDANAVSASSAKSSAADVLAEVLVQINRSVDSGHKVFFPNGIELIQISVQAGPAKVEIKVAGPKAGT